MAEPIRPKDLPAAPSVPADASIVMDNGVAVLRATPALIAATARPYANQGQAEAGADNATTMTPLRTKQAIDSQIIGKAQAAAIGVPGSDNDMGTFDGSTIPTGSTVKEALQAVETALETTSGDAAIKSNAVAIGIAATDTNMGSATGPILPDDGTAKEWFQVLETAIMDGGSVNFTYYYQFADGVDWSPALQRALDTGRNVFVPEGRWLRLTSVTTKGQRIQGCGVTRSVFVIGDATHSFTDMAALGVDITTNAYEDTSYGHDGIGFEFYQPNTNIRANVIQYPWAIYCSGVDRPDFGDVRVSNGWNGIYADGCGGMKAGVIELGCFNRPLIIDHAYDTTSIKALKFWPYGSGNAESTVPLLYQVYQDGQSWSEIGRVDGLSISLFATFQQRVKFYQSDAGGHLFGTIGEFHLDGTYGRIEIASAYLSVGTWYASTGSNTDFKISMTSGRLALGPCGLFLGPGGGGTASLIQVTGGYFVAQSGGFFEALGTAQPLLTQSGGEVVWIGGEILGLTNQVRTRAVFETTAGRLTLRDPRFSDIGTGSGNAVAISSDENHDIEINALLGWSVSLPSSVALGNYSFDRNFAAIATVDFATPGDSSFTYTTQATSYRIQGGICQFKTSLLFNTNAFTTASGAFRVKPNIPFLPTYAQAVTISSMANVTFDNTKDFCGEMQTDGTILIRILTSNGALGNFGTANVPASKTGVQIYVTGSFFV